jgi:integrase
VPKKLTAAVTQGAVLAAGKNRHTIYDTEVRGLGLRLSAGSKTWIYKYRPLGGGRATHQRMIRLGTFPALTPAEARLAAKAYAGAIARGNDPLVEIRAARLKDAEGNERTLKVLLADGGPYERHLKRRRIVNARTAMSSLRRAFAALRQRDVRSLTRQDFARELNKILDAGKTGAYGDAKKFGRSFLEWALNEGIVSGNVLAGMRSAKRTRAELIASHRRKARALDDDEIRRIWAATEYRGAFGRVIRLLLLTGARRSEIAKLTPNRLLSDRIVMEMVDTKQGRRHMVPRTPLMDTVIASQPATARKFLFPSEVTGRPILGWTKLVTGLQRESGVTFRLHDLRRTTRTLMSRLGIDDAVAEASIGHKRKGLDALYNFDGMWDRRVASFAAVSAHVENLTRVKPTRAVAVAEKIVD